MIPNKTGGILAIDLGTKTGWAARMPDGGVCHGTEEFKAGRMEGGGMVYVRFRKWLGDIFYFTGCSRIYFEEVAGFGKFHATLNATVWGGFYGHLSEYCEGTLIPYRGIPVGTIKKHACGRGNASKQDVIEAVKKLGFTPKDDNAADALAILHCAEAKEAEPKSKAAA